MATHTVRDWMSSPVIVVDPDCSVSYAINLMRQRKVRSLVVMLENEEHDYGIITTTDVRDKILAANRNPAETRVREVMTSPIFCAEPEWTLTECSRRMAERKIQHVPVQGENGELVGLISVTDLLVAAEEVGWED